MTATYVDANVLVYAFGDLTHPRRAGARAALERAAETGPVVTCALTIDEFLWARRRAAGPEAAVADARALLAAPVLHIVAVELQHARAAVDNVARYRLRPRDAFHAAVAQATRCASILSDDADFDVVPGLKRVAP